MTIKIGAAPPRTILAGIDEMIGRWNLFAVLALAATVAAAQAPPPPPAAAPAFSQAELDQMLAPVALYPDELLSQILMAATYPLELVEAARWASAHRGLSGEQAVSAAADQPWDPSVKSLLAFPQILSMMDQKLDWTQRLGNAFLAQGPQVMETVQQLRQRAYASGNLQSNDRQIVQQQAGSIVVVPAAPQVVYVPYYDPLVVYGPWWWPAYPPVYWPPWPGYVVAPAPGYWWGMGIGISVGFFFGAFDWPHRHVVVVHAPPRIYHPLPGRPPPAPGVWRHEPDHRRGVPYRSEPVRREFGQAPRPSAPPRLDYRGREAPTPRTLPAPAVKPQPPAAARTQPQARAPISQPPHAFEGIRAGGERTRQFSERGQASISHAQRPAPSAAPRTATPAPRTGGAVPRSGGAAPSGAAKGHR